jgi:hypothetical protein
MNRSSKKVLQYRLSDHIEMKRTTIIIVVLFILVYIVGLIFPIKYIEFRCNISGCEDVLYRWYDSSGYIARILIIYPDGSKNETYYNNKN